MPVPAFSTKSMRWRRSETSTFRRTLLRPRSAQGQTLGQAAGAGHLNSVGVYLDEDVGTVEKPVAVHDRIGDRLAQGLHWVLRDVLPLESLDPVGGASIALDETQSVLDVGHKPAVKILAIQDVNLILALCQQTGDVGLREEMTHVTGEEEHTRISEKQFVAHSLGGLNVGQHVLDRRAAGRLCPND